MDIINSIGMERVLHPEGLSVGVDIGLLYQQNPEAAMRLTGAAGDFYSTEKEVREFISSKTGKTQRYRLRPFNLSLNTAISDLTQQTFENKVVQFKGIVTQVAPVRKLTSHKVWRCQNNHIREEFGVTVDQMLDMPRQKSRYLFCKVCRGKALFKLSTKECSLVSIQRVVMQEMIEEIALGKPASNIIGYALDDLATNRVTAGDKIIAVGTLFPDIRETTQSSSVYVELLSIQKMNSSFEEIKITLEDIARFKELRNNPDLYDTLIKSFAPTIYGYPHEKLALLCSLFGSPRLKRDSTDIRGDIHCLLAGDPATAKSKMIRWAAKVSPRGVCAIGGKATTAGLTCSWSRGKDDVPELKPGAMVIADGGGLVCLDECDKMSSTDRMSIHGPMEDQVLDVAQAGTIQTFNTRCSVVAAANPKGSRYDPQQSLKENVDLDDAFLSRFDLIFIIRDNPEVGTDTKLTEHILQTHSGTMRHGPIPMELLRKYIAYARRNVDPDLTPNSEPYELIKEGYLKIRLGPKAMGDLSVTPRQLEGLVRLSKAIARMQLSSVVTKEHAKMALELFEASSHVSSLESEIPAVTAQSEINKKWGP